MDKSGAELRAKAEALKIILSLDPEDQLNEYVRWHSCGASGDSAAAWDEEKLKKLFGVDPGESPIAKISDELEGMYWDLAAQESDIQHLKDNVELLVREIHEHRTPRTEPFSHYHNVVTLLGLKLAERDKGER